MSTTYAVALDVDQNPNVNGLCARQWGTLAHCRSYIGHYPGANQRLFAESELVSREAFRSNTGASEPGGIFKVSDQ